MESCMNWGMIVAIIGANIALVAIVVAFIIWTFNKLDGDIKSLSSDIKAQTQRTDRLYQMFIDLLKVQKIPKTHP